MKYIAAIDQGTTSTCCMVFNRQGGVVCHDQKEHERIYPKVGWVEQDPLEIWHRTQEDIYGAMKKGGPETRQIAALGVMNQRERNVVWEKKSGKPVHNAIVWQDTRTDVICDELAKVGGKDRTKAHIARAALEATAFQTREVLESMDKDSGVPLTALKVDDGMVHNDLLMQFQADILGVPVIRLRVAETTPLGAAYAVGLAVGFWKGYDELLANWGKDHEWQLRMQVDQREKLYDGWKKAVTRTFGWVELTTEEN